MALISRVETDDLEKSSVPGDIMRSRNALARCGRLHADDLGLRMRTDSLDDGTDGHAADTHFQGRFDDGASASSGDNHADFMHRMTSP